IADLHEEMLLGSRAKIGVPLIIEWDRQHHRSGAVAAFGDPESVHSLASVRADDCIRFDPDRDLDLPHELLLCERTTIGNLRAAVSDERIRAATGSDNGPMMARRRAGDRRPVV